MHAVRDRRAATAPEVERGFRDGEPSEADLEHLDSLRRAEPDTKRARLKPTALEVSSALRQPFSKWAHPTNAGVMVKRGEFVSVIGVMLRPLHEEVERLHKALYAQQERSWKRRVARILRWFRAPVNG